MIRRRGAMALAALMLAGVRPASAQLVEPHADWRTLSTMHFNVHFTPVLEEAARRAAAQAEQAYERLAAELTPPRGTIDLVVADNLDASNGSATPFPSNRMFIYVQPPLDVPSLRFYDDWLALVITHELVHIFQLDRAGGWWGVAQRIFGRVPFLMPNVYVPAWVIEGLATYYESALTKAGRVAGSHERMLVRASVIEHDLPSIDRWSLATTRHPGGETAYAYGSLFIDFLARTRGSEGVTEFVERLSSAALPFTLNRAARKSFGASLQGAWRQWRDSLRARVPASTVDGPVPEWRDLTDPGRMTRYPRWVDSSALVFASNPGPEIPGVYRVDTRGHVRRLARRNGVDRNVPLADGGLLFGQVDYVTPYELRSDLYAARNGRVRRLTRGARLSTPDARSDGSIVAVRSVGGTNQLVRLNSHGRVIRPLTSASPDTQWAEPRWSPGGDRIAATRWTRGAYADIVVLDSLGRLLHEITHDRAVDTSPSWSPDGSAVLFTSDRTGVAEAYMLKLESVPRYSALPGSAPKRLSRAAAGLFGPVVSPDADYLAAVRYTSDGWRLGIAPFDTAGADTPDLDPALLGDDPAPAPRYNGPARPYSPWRSLLPRHWLPLLGEAVGGGLAVGALTSGRDVIGRHSYAAEALFDTRGAAHELVGHYRYAGFGQPLIDIDASQDWNRTPVVDDASQYVGDLRRRTRRVALSATLTRPRMRTNGLARLSAEFEERNYSTDPDPLLADLDPFFGTSPTYWSLLGIVGWSNVQIPTVAISPEDGASFSLIGRLRWLSSEGGLVSRSLAGILSGYKSIGKLWGYSHHVLAARVAAGYADGRVPGEFSVGGASGSPVVLLPGLSLGERRVFGVRGFPAGARLGTRALAGSVEYRAPFTLPARGFGLWPIFLDRTSFSLFADAGAAWGAGSLDAPATSNWLGSVGVEVIVDLAVPYDVPYHVRLGFAVPVLDESSGATRQPSVYVRLGASF